MLMVVLGGDLQIEIIDLGGFKAGVYSFRCSVELSPWHFGGEEDFFALKAGIS